MTRLFGRLMCHLGYHWHADYPYAIDGVWVSVCEREGCTEKDYATNPKVSP